MKTLVSVLVVLSLVGASGSVLADTNGVVAWLGGALSAQQRTDTQRACKVGIEPATLAQQECVVWVYGQLTTPELQLATRNKLISNYRNSGEAGFNTYRKNLTDACMMDTRSSDHDSEYLCRLGAEGVLEPIRTQATGKRNNN